MFNADEFFNAKRVVNEHTVETNKKSPDFNPKYTEQPKEQFPETETMDTEIVPLFPSYLLMSKLNSKYVKMMEPVVENESANQQQNMLIHSGRFCYQSNEDLHVRYENVKQVCVAVEALIKEKYNLNVEIKDSWLNVNGINGFNYEHNHSGIISGCFYVHVPEDSNSDIVFHNPAIRSESCPVINKFNERYMMVTPESGDLILFPSWLTHHVEPNKSQQNRITIGFNAFLK